MMTDPIADMLTRIRNAYRIDAPSVDIPHSKVKEALAKVLVEEGYSVQYQVFENQPRNIIRLQLRYGSEGDKAIRSIKRISTPGRRVYAGYETLRPVLRGMGVRILSTNRGVMSDRKARREKVGGEVLCEIY